MEPVIIGGWRRDPLWERQNTTSKPGDHRSQAHRHFYPLPSKFWIIVNAYQIKQSYMNIQKLKLYYIALSTNLCGNAHILQIQ